MAADRTEWRVRAPGYAVFLCTLSFLSFCPARRLYPGYIAGHSARGPETLLRPRPLRDGGESGERGLGLGLGRRGPDPLPLRQRRAHTHQVSF